MLKKEFEERNERLFNELVPANGKCETLGGEIIRAVNRVSYRYYNDGDIAWKGYGCQTVNPAVRFLMHIVGHEECPSEFVKAVYAVYKIDAYGISDDEYEALIDKMVEAAVDFVESCDLGKKDNTYGDMWDYKNDEFDYDQSEDYEDVCYDEDDEW